jgi:hypothetical protein
MSGDPLATPQDLQKWWGKELSDGLYAAAVEMLEYTSAVVRRRIPDLDDRLDANEGGLAVLAKGAVVRRVLAVMRNPESVRQWTVGDLSITRDTLAERIGLIPGDDELLLLRKAPTPTARRNQSNARLRMVL